MDYAVILSVILGLVMVPLVSFLKKDHWDNRLNFGIAVAVSAAIGGAQLVFNNHVHSFTQFVSLWGTTLAMSQAAFHMYFADSGFDKYLTNFGATVKTIETTVGEVKTEVSK